MALREPFRTPGGAFMRSSLKARARVEDPFPLNTPQYLDGYLADNDEVVNSPHGMPNCNAQDPANPESATQLRPRTGFGYPGATYIVISEPPDDDTGHIVVDLGRVIFDQLDYGVPVQVNNACIAYGPIARKVNLNGTLPPSAEQGVYRCALLGQGDGTLDWQFNASGNLPGEPPREDLWDRYLTNTLATSGESPQSQIFDAPANAVKPNTRVAFARCATLHSPVMWLTNVSGHSVTLARVRVDSVLNRWAFAYVTSGSPTPGTMTTATINAVGWGTPHIIGSPIVPETATLTINWI